MTNTLIWTPDADLENLTIKTDGGMDIVVNFGPSNDPSYATINGGIETETGGEFCSQAYFSIKGVMYNLATLFYDATETMADIRAQDKQDGEDYDDLTS